MRDHLTWRDTLSCGLLIWWWALIVTFSNFMMGGTHKTLIRDIGAELRVSDDSIEVDRSIRNVTSRLGIGSHS